MLRTGSPVEVNIGGWAGVGCEGMLFVGRVLVGEAGARFNPPGRVGRLNVGLATPEPMRDVGVGLVGSETAAGCRSVAGVPSCRVLANFIEPVSPRAVLGSLGMRVISKVFPAWSRPESLTTSWVV